MTTTQFYTWQSYPCAYDCHHPPADSPLGTPLLLIHPIGVGLSRQFWQRFLKTWYQQGHRQKIYNPDLLGCGESAMPRLAYHPDDWAAQLEYFVKTIIQEPVIIVAQGALAPVALACVARFPDLIRGMVWSGPPAWRLITTPTQSRQQKIAWNLFDTPLGVAFYRYARREAFLRSFSQRQLFAQESDIDGEWLEQLHQGSRNLNSRHAVFSFLSGFWRQDYGKAIASIPCPTLVLFGEGASSVTRGYVESADQRLGAYLDHLPQGEGRKIPGRNVLPYESTAVFVEVVGEFIS
ncbi:alpha/beta fold hydrolase [Spirulina subsalsa]|uniref:alpha/beta fold hydrolase n=1 Tax=Spirulina subsalsa TaxID=54311 RepID=UPI0002E29BF5|nr:alpha/beta hydrolase [Spirulina subsalsa]